MTTYRLEIPDWHPAILNPGVGRHWSRCPSLRAKRRPNQSFGGEPFERRRLIDRHDPGNCSAMLGDCDGVPLADLGEMLAQPVAQCSDPDFHRNLRCGYIDDTHCSHNSHPAYGKRRRERLESGAAAQATPRCRAPHGPLASFAGTYKCRSGTSVRPAGVEPATKCLEAIWRPTPC